MRRRVVLALVVVVLLVSWVANPFRANAGSWFSQTLDGAGGPNGATTDDVGQFNAALMYGGAPHNWYYDYTSGDLRHGWWTGTVWATETIDAGPNGGASNVGLHISAVLYGGQPHVWYWDGTGGDLRHAWWTGAVWATETLDGAGGANGRIDAFLGSWTSATLYGGQPNVWYYDTTNGDLRHAWWNGVAWAFETLDGAGGANGRIDADVGTHTTAIVYNGQPHVWYWLTNGFDLRHGWWNGASWSFETLDGAGGSNGQTTNNVGWYGAAILYGDQLHLWYWDATAGDLRHAWWNGSAWTFETLDGSGGADGRIDAYVGQYNAVTLYNGEPHVWYRDADNEDLRHGWWNGVAWAFETLDGNATDSGRTTNNVGWSNSVVVDGAAIHVFNYDFTAKDDRQACYC